jgi:hypothetical protein
MPTHKYIITVSGGFLNGLTITKFSKEESHMTISCLKERYRLECSVQHVKLY